MNIKKRSQKPKLAYRRWLNPVGDNDTGSVDMLCEEETVGSYKHYYLTFVVSDCSRKASLDLSYNNKKEYDQRLKKIRRLINALLLMEAWMKNHPPKKKKKAKK